MGAAPCWKIAFAAALLGVFAAHGAQLPLRRYTTAEGLVNNTVYHIVSDPRGFLWFGTGEGLSRFDGYGFSNLTTRDGLPHRAVTRVLIDRRGTYWLATPAGLVRYRPDQPGPGRVSVVQPNGTNGSERINSLLEDRTGRIWVGTYAGIFTVDPQAARRELLPVDIGMPANSPKWGGSIVESMAEDPEGAIWIGGYDGTLYRRWPDGRVERYSVHPAVITELLTDRHGRLWIGTERGLYRAAPHARPGTAVFEPLFGTNGVPQARVFALLESREGDVWAGMYEALAQFPRDGGPARVWDSNSGLGNKSVMALSADRDGNLWLGTDDLGAWKLAAERFLTYSTEDGIGTEEVISVAETLRGELYATARKDQTVFVNVRQGEHFRAVRPRVPKSITYYGWRPGQIVLQDHTGEWWLATYAGLCRYPRLESPVQLARTPPLQVYTTRDGLPSDYVIRLYEDRRANVWLGSEMPGWFGYWSRREEKFVRVSADATARPAAFGEDAAGHVWIGDDEGKLWRVEEGRALRVGGSPTGRGWINGFLFDRSGRLWVATSSGGLLRSDQPLAQDPQFRAYGLTEGLSSASVRCLLEDGDGSIYLGTGGGVDRLDPDSGHVRHYTAADGLAPGQVRAAYRDRSGTIWFAASHGLTRMSPGDHRPKTAPAIWITGLSIAGRAAPVSGSGERVLRDVELQPGQEQIQFDFVGLSYAPGDLLHYQHRIGEAAWSAPTLSRSANYSALPPGRYRFAVRAINSGGAPSPEPALVEFRVIAPVWRRTWFHAIFIAAAVAGAIAVHRVRVRRLIEIERVRMRIAGDLHDDLGSSLSQIAILSDVARVRAAGGEPLEPLERIGSLSRDLLETMSDIVWAIQPPRDRLSDLKRRMRHFAAEVLSARNIEMHWLVDELERDVPLAPEFRRQVYLVFKESINNLARHSGATEARILLQLAGRQLALEVSDNGRGFERWDGPDGNGLKNMKLRAASLGGTLEVGSIEGRGTAVVLRASLPVQVVRRGWFRSKVGK